LMQLDLHWSELAYQVTGTPNNRSALRARFDPAFREKHLRQSCVKVMLVDAAVGKHYTGTLSLREAFYIYNTSESKRRK
jgi:hypothetical protein